MNLDAIRRRASDEGESEDDYDLAHVDRIALLVELDRYRAAVAELLATLPRCTMRALCRDIATHTLDAGEGPIRCCDQHSYNGVELPYAAAVRKLREVMG